MAFRILESSVQWNSKTLFPSRGRILDNEYAVLVLNHALDGLTEPEEAHFGQLWDAASKRISVDGATNQLYNYFNKIKLPDLISGDFDSINASLLRKYEEKGVPSIHTADQNHTDFSKALQLLESLTPNLPNYIITFWQSTHRLDSIFSVISELHIWNSKVKNCPIFLIDMHGSVSWVLYKGKNVILPHTSERWCSVIPFLGETVVSSKGLRYEMNSLKLSFESIVSTSNQISPDAEKVEIDVDNSVLWSQYFKSPT